MQNRYISYGTVPYKAVAVPFSEDAGITAGVSDFAQYNSVPMTDATEMFFRRDRSNLYLTVVCHEESGKVDARLTDGKPSLWNGSDQLEIFFGAVEPTPWLTQLALSANGCRFDSTGDYDSWQARVTVEEKCWRADITLALSKLKIQNLGCGFNIARSAHEGTRISVWSRMEYLFHEFENYGELLFCDYETAYFAKMGMPSAGPLSRSEFETAVMSRSCSPEKVIHGPWLSNPEQTGMSVSFSTAGLSGAFVEYRLQGEKDWIRLDCQKRHGLLPRNRRIHVCNISGLLPGRTYEYRVISLKPVSLAECCSEIHTFHTNPDQTRDFSFILFSDVHSNAAHVRAVMKRPEARQSDFIVNLGDYLSSTSGPDGYYDAFLDIQAETFGKEKPLVFARGNHEQVGIFADEINEIMPHPSGRTYYSFFYSDVMFVVLDPGNDHDDDESGIRTNRFENEKQHEWLKQLSETPEYRNAAFRVCLVHFPPQELSLYDSQAVVKVVGDVKFDLMLCGHEHQYFRIDPMTGVCNCLRIGTRKCNAAKVPYPVVANDTDTVLQVLRQGSHITVRAITATGELIDEIVI